MALELNTILYTIILQIYQFEITFAYPHTRQYMHDVEKTITNNKSRIYLQTIMCHMFKSLIYIRSP